MGLGDYIHWTAIIRDLDTYINKTSETFDIKMDKINTFIQINTLDTLNTLNKSNKLSQNNILYNKLIVNKKIKPNKNDLNKNQLNLNNIGIIDVSYENTSDDFKFFILIGKKFLTNSENLHSNKGAKEIFLNNPYVTYTKDYTNIITIKIISNYYWASNNSNNNFKVLDNKHIVSLYADTIKINNYSVEGELYITENEKKYVNNFIPTKKFIFVSFQGKINTRSYSKKNFQLLINKIKETYTEYEIIQIIPAKFKNTIFESIENITTYINNFSFRETIFFASHATLCIVPHGGLSIGLACFKTPTICLYSSLFNPIMTTYKSEIPIIYTKKNHDFCYNLNCQKCIENREKHNYIEIYDNIVKILK